MRHHRSLNALRSRRAKLQRQIQLVVALREAVNRQISEAPPHLVQAPARPEPMLRPAAR
jgi:hypothetical protein